MQTTIARQISANETRGVKSKKFQGSLKELDQQDETVFHTMVLRDHFQRVTASGLDMNSKM